jgi:type II secretory pathway predicted ATPase ExeA
MKFDCHQIYSQTSSELFETPISHSNPETCRHSTGVPVSAYLKFFELERSPFDAKAQGQVVLGTRAIRDAFAAIESGIAEGASIICVNGGPGIGKTSLARALPKLLGDKARVALVPDPALSWESSRTTLARQWGIESGGVVLVTDQAEKADEESLDYPDVPPSYRSESDFGRMGCDPRPQRFTIHPAPGPRRSS